MRLNGTRRSWRGILIFERQGTRNKGDRHPQDADIAQSLRLSECGIGMPPSPLDNSSDVYRARTTLFCWR